MTELLSRLIRSAVPTAGLVGVAVVAGCVRTATGVASMPGVEPTPPTRLPPDASVCNPVPASTGVRVAARVADPAAPRLTVTVPDKSFASPSHGGDLALTLLGRGTVGTVSIAKTNLTAAEAFTKFTAYLTRSKHQLTEVVGASFCGFSSQKLSGTDSRINPREFVFRLTCISTNAGNYLVTIHLSGRAHSPQYGAAKAALMQDFAIVIP